MRRIGIFRLPERDERAWGALRTPGRTQFISGPTYSQDRLRAWLGGGAGASGGCEGGEGGERFLGDMDGVVGGFAREELFEVGEEVFD
jgi:hypothetical protein